MLLLVACTKTWFMFNSKFYEQKDGVSMGLPSGLTLAIIIMTGLEEKLIKKFAEDGTIKFYGHFLDDTLVAIKSKDTVRVDQALNK